jgi:2-C-methyl-D-erythritol 2,4-cyclodiphosphate synthase
MTTTRVGLGFDTHRFSADPDRALVLGGVLIAGHAGLIGHSDADAITHAVIDAILGAAGLGDIGEHFPDTDPRWKGADSIEMLKATADVVGAAGWDVGNIDCTIVAERPRLSPHRASMQARLSETVGAPVSIKASRAEAMGALGRVEGVACWAVAILSKEEDK